MSSKLFQSDNIIMWKWKNSSPLLVQYLGACIASLAAFSAGTTLAWTSPATPLLLKGLAGFPVNDNENSWIGGLMPIGAALSCIPTGLLVDQIGRKITLLALAPLGVLGWSLLIWANSVGMFYAGRFITGITAGAACVVVPVYTAEICHKSVRGTIGSFYQLFLVIGVLFMYVIGTQMSLFWFTATGGIIPIIFGCGFIFFPDTPIYYVNKCNNTKARESLLFFRDPKHDIETELTELTMARASCGESQKCKTQTMWQVFRTMTAIKSVIISISMMIFEQLSGIKPIVFYPTSIFQDAGSSLKPEYCTIVLGVMEVLSTFVAAFLTDRLGRRMLLTISAGVMSICTFGLGLFFYFQNNGYFIENILWLPLLLLCTYVILYSVGYGPVPWTVMAELLPCPIKGTAISLACVVNWFCAFAMAKFYNDMVTNLGADVTFWFFGSMSIFATIFSWFVIPETKGKTFDEIQRDLEKSRSHRRL